MQQRLCLVEYIVHIQQHTTVSITARALTALALLYYAGVPTDTALELLRELDDTTLLMVARNHMEASTPKEVQ